MGDRCGSREAKGSSLKKSKSNPGCTAAKKKKAPKLIPGSLFSATPPVPINGSFFDCGTALLSRQFERDRERVIARAESDGVSPILIWFSDIEKQAKLVDVCKESKAGLCYYACGVHPDNIDRTNKKHHEGWLEKVEELGRRPECIALLGGLNVTRDVGTHFPQEAMLRGVCSLAEKLNLPLMLHCSDASSLERALEVLREEEWIGDFEGESLHIVVHDAVTACGGSLSVLQAAIDAGCYFSVSAVGLTDEDSAARARAIECVKMIPSNRILTCTDSPWRTPQNHPDAYLRTLRNEPCNILYVNVAVFSALSESSSQEELNERLRSNALRAFGLEFGELNELQGTIQDLAIGAVATAEADPAASTTDTTQEGGTIAASAASISSAVSADAVPAAEPEPAPKQQSQYYWCHKCRTRLFPCSQVTRHGVFESARTVFRAGQEAGVCRDVLMVPCAEEDVQSFGMSIRGKSTSASNTVDCSVCGLKLGKFCLGEGLCSCGASVAGPLVRVLATKVDEGTEGVAQADLLQRARHEAENFDLAAEEDEGLKDSKKPIKKGKKVASANKGNFSSFRNKTFVPNASRAGKGDVDDGEDHADDGGQKPVSKTKRSHKGNEDDSDSDNA